jgi:PAS domain-containing protein
VTNPGAGVPTPSLPLILARELASNLATPMFLIDARGMLVYFNEAAEVLLGKPFSEIGEMDALEWGAMLQISEPDGTPVRRRDTPAGIAFFERRPSHRRFVATGHDGARHHVEATAYPLFAATDDLHGVISVFWEVGPAGADT